jgi:hypothetical protein
VPIPLHSYSGNTASTRTSPVSASPLQNPTNLESCEHSHPLIRPLATLLAMASAVIPSDASSSLEIGFSLVRARTEKSSSTSDGNVSRNISSMPLSTRYSADGSRSRGKNGNAALSSYWRTSVTALWRSIVRVHRPEVAGQRPSVGRHEPEISITDVSLRGPTYLKNSHAHHTWDSSPHQTACFTVSEALPVWVRFPSPAPEFHPVRRPLAAIGSSAGWRFVSRQAKRTASTSSGVIRPSPAVCSRAAAASAKTPAETFAAAP